FHLCSSVAGKISLQHHGLSLSHDEDFVLYAVSPSGCEQSSRWLVERLETERKRSVMHRDQSFGAELLEGFHRLFWVHVNFAASGRLVSANWKQCDVDLVAFADFFESREISGVAAVKNRATVRRDDKSAKIAVQIRKEPGAPVMTWSEGNFQRPKLAHQPIIELVYE